MKLIYIIKSSRLKTIPLCLAGVAYASKVAYINDIFSIKIFFFYIITAVLLQVLSNFSNDLGDALKGTDKLRSDKAPERMVASKKISFKQMKIIVIITSIISFISGVILSYIAFENFFIIVFFSILGVLAIISALKYTMGKRAYGYMGMGDLFVFVFFGLVNVLGGYYLYSKSMDLSNILPAIAFGLLSVGVLNINNLRDYYTDKQSNKNTLVVKIGYKNGVIYHFAIIIIAFLCLSFSDIFLFEKKYSLIVISFFLITHLANVFMGKNIDGQLKKLSLITLISSLS